MRAIITGISGQDGYFLSQLLLSKGYEVYGIVRRNSSMTQGTVDFLPDYIREKIHIEYGDIIDVNFLMDLMHKEKPDEIYHLATDLVIFLVTNSGLLTSDSWLKSIPFDMNNLYASLYVLTVHIPASFDTA